MAPGESFEDVLPGSGLSGAGKCPTARVVGIIKRNWRTRGYCGSLKPDKKTQGSTGAEGAGGGGGGGKNFLESVLFIPVEKRYPMIRCGGKIL